MRYKHWTVSQILEDISERLERLEQKEYLMTDRISYTDVLGNEGSYRRIGDEIEFTALYPPEGIDIKTSTLMFNGDVKRAKVHGWETTRIQL